MEAAVDPAAPPAAASCVTPHVRRRAGVVAVVERDSAAVARLVVERGVRVLRSAVARNGENGVAWNTGDPAAVARALSTLLERAKLPRRVDVLAPSQSLFGLTCTVVPPVKGETRAALLARRLRDAVSDARGEWLVDHAPIGNPGDEEASFAPAVMAWADRAAIAELEAGLRAERIGVGRVIPPLVGLLHLMGHTRGPGAGGAVLVVHVGLPSLCILLFDGEDLLYVRPMRDVLASAPEQLPEVAQTEVQRTLAYFRENQHGRRVDQVLVSGLPREAATRFSQWLAAGLGTACEPLGVGRSESREAGEREGEGESEDALAAHLPVLAGALLPGLRGHLPARRPMNLLHERPRRLPVGLAAAGLVLAGVSAAAWTRESWANEAQTQSRHAARLETELARLTAGSEERAAALAEQERMRAQEQALEAIGAGGSSVRAALEAVLLVPPRLALAGAKVTRAPATATATAEVPVDPAGGGGELADASASADASAGAGARLELRLRGDFTGSGPRLVDELVQALEQRPWCASARTAVAGARRGEGLDHDEVRVEVALR